MSSLPDEMYQEILKRVPVTSVVACKCICKSWNSMISDPNFVKLHLEHTTETNNSSLLIKTNRSYRLYCSSSGPDFVKQSATIELQTPFKYLGDPSSRLLGSCNGLLYGCRNRALKFFYLWNPATMEFRRVPKLDAFNYDHHGFGYDHKTDVVIDTGRAQNEIAHKKTCLIQVYSLKSNSWRSLEPSQYVFDSISKAGVFFNGALHWFEDKASSILSMDICEERFGTLQLPGVPQTQNFTSIGVFKERLCVVAKVDDTNYDVWVMQDYGVPESWTYFCTISSENPVEIVGSFQNGEILYREIRPGDVLHIYSYDSESRTAKKAKIFFIDTGGAVKYFQSLVSLKLNTVKGTKKKRESTTKKRKQVTAKSEGRIKVRK